MSKRIHTIQSSDKKEFDKEVNLFLELGFKFHDGGYEVIKNFVLESLCRPGRWCC